MTVQRAPRGPAHRWLALGCSTLRAPRGPAQRRPDLASRLATAIASLALFSCPAPQGAQADLPSPKNRVRPGHAPAPFSPDELRRACPSGHFRRYLVEVPGQPPLFRTLTFEEATKDSVEIASRQVDARGRAFGEQRRQRAAWKALQAHASFPRSDTTIRRYNLITLAGSFETWLYEVRGRKGDERERYWFAWTLPGPPVQYERHAHGKLVFRMTLLGHGRSRAGTSPSPRPGDAAAPGSTPSPQAAPGPKTVPSPLPAPPRK